MRSLSGAEVVGVERVGLRRQWPQPGLGADDRRVGCRLREAVEQAGQLQGAADLFVRCQPGIVLFPSRRCPAQRLVLQPELAPTNPFAVAQR
jgi:hypothetical protein